MIGYAGGMTEAQWLVLAPSLMMQHIAQVSPASYRKLRLLAVAYARYLETQPDYSGAKHVSYLGDEVVEGRQTLDALWDNRIRGWGYEGDWRIANLVLAADERLDMQTRTSMMHSLDCWPNSAAQREHVARGLIVCVLGNPFRPVVADRCWLTFTVIGVADSIYTDRAFDRLPILADALQDAGCEAAELLAHCHGSGPHARGCWAVDLVLGKA